MAETLYCRITLSDDEIGDYERFSGQIPRGVRSSKIQTGCPFEIGGVFEVRSCRGSRIGMNSFNRRFQKCLKAAVQISITSSILMISSFFLRGMLNKNIPEKKKVRSQGFDVEGRRQHSFCGSYIH